MLKLDNVSAGYGELEVIRNISLEVGAGQTVVVLGPNGAGKSTLLKVITGLVKPARGSVSFNNQRIDTLPPHKIFENGIAYVPEGGRLFPELTVSDNLKMGCYNKTVRKNYEENLSEVFKLFERLAERKAQVASTMSGGERQMVAIARALISKPKLLILDEPSAGLAPKIVNNIFDFVGRIKALGYSVLMVEQTIKKAIPLADYCYLIESGEIKFQGTKDSLLDNPKIKDAYLGI